MADVPPVVIRPLTEADLADADRVLRVAFGTFVGVPEPRGAGPGHGYGPVRGGFWAVAGNYSPGE